MDRATPIADAVKGVGKVHPSLKIGWIGADETLQTPAGGDKVAAPQIGES